MNSKSGGKIYKSEHMMSTYNKSGKPQVTSLTK